MARWKLTEPHYLFGYPPDLADEGTEWEYKETDRVNGRERRKRFKVPFYFESDTFVCHVGKGLPTDSVFEGPPTPAMEPLDDEARAISESFAGQWKHPIETLPGQGFNASILGSLEGQLASLAAKLPQTSSVVADSQVSKDEFDALKAQLAELMAEKAEREATGEAKPVSGGVRRKVA